MNTAERKGFSTPFMVTMPLDLSQFDTETEYGEPQHWIELEKGRHLEVVHEEHGMPEEEQYYSWRVHCSDEEFAADKFKGTMGIIDVVTSSSYDGETILNNLTWAFDVARRVA